MTVDWLTGDALQTIRTLDTASVDLVACSPPFLALRNYNDIDGQWGSEATPAAFLDNLLTLAVECRRVLAPHGSLAFELGDTYSGSGGGGEPAAVWATRQQFTRDTAPSGNTANGGPGWPLAKSLTGVPTLFAWSLAYGHNLLNPAHEFDPWRIRNVIVWARNNPPVGALGDKYRPATSYITVACPSDRRWFDLDAVRTASRDPIGRGATNTPPHDALAMTGPGRYDSHPAGAPPLDHWTDTYDGDLTWLINSAGSSLAHYAMWPARLAERLILSMCPAEVCRECGEPRRRIAVTTNAVGRRPDVSASSKRKGLDTDRIGVRFDLNGAPDRAERYTLGWSSCDCADYRPGRVLDPFAGTGTTLAVADIHGRDATGIDLDPHNADLYQRRYAECWRALKPDAGPSPVTEQGTQGTLL